MKGAFRHTLSLACLSFALTSHAGAQETTQTSEQASDTDAILSDIVVTATKKTGDNPLGGTLAPLSRGRVFGLELRVNN